MAQEIRSFAATIPPGTAQAAGFTVDLSFPARIVTKIVVRVPPGPRGHVGFQLGSAGQPVIPWNTGGYIVTDDEVLDWELDDFIDSGSWTFFGYNTGIFLHTIYVRFELNVVTQAVAPTPSNLPASDLSPAPIVGGVPVPITSLPVTPLPPVAAPVGGGVPTTGAPPTLAAPPSILGPSGGPPVGPDTMAEVRDPAGNLLAVFTQDGRGRLFEWVPTDTLHGLGWSVLDISQAVINAGQVAPTLADGTGV